MTSEMILCKQIDEPTPAVDAKQRRAFSKDFARKLAESIRIDGQLQPIVVRPNPESPGRYILVAGKHRFHAIAVVLKHEAIECKAIADMDEIDAIMAKDAENLWRNPLTKPQHLLALQRWHDHYAAKYPEKVVGRAKAGGLARGKQRSEESQARRQQQQGEPEPGPTPDPAAAPQASANLADACGAAADPAPAPEPQSFADLVSSATGVSRRSAERSIRLAKMFTPDQIEVFDSMGVRQAQMEAIVKVPDPARRNEIVNLIASGMEPDEAIAAITDPANAEKADADLTDEEWAEKVCKDLYGRITHKPRFLSDVALYRGTVAAVGQLKSKVHKNLAATRGQRGSYGRLLFRLLNLSHPKRWLLCGRCRGTATVNGQLCESCYGDGYKTTSEG